jgi:hypothetical protein
MKNRKQFHTNYSAVDSDFVLKKVSKLLEDAVPKNMLGMIALSKPTDNSIIFYDRWELIPYAKNNYAIYDRFTQEFIYENIALFSSALSIVYNFNRKIARPCSVDKVIYRLDQEYYRCLDQIRFYQKKLRESKKDNTELFAIKLIDKQHRLHEIKTQLSKVY